MSPDLVLDRIELWKPGGGVGGWVEVYDDYSLEWEYDGSDYPEVKKMLFRLENGEREERIVPGDDYGEQDNGDFFYEEDYVDETPQNFHQRVKETMESRYSGLDVDRNP